MNSGKNLVLLQPNNTSPDLVDAIVYETQMDLNLFDLLLPINISNLKSKMPHSRQTFHFENSSMSDLKIKQIQTRIFDDEAYYFNNRYVAKDVKEAFLTINLNNTKLQSLKLNIISDAANDYFETKLLHEVEALNDYITSISTSHLIAGESAVFLEKSGEIHLLTQELENIKTFNDKTRLAANLKPRFESKHDWKSVHFGAQPRQFIYSDHSQVLSIDSRIKTKDAHQTRELFKLSTKYVDTHELINRTQIAENECFYHLICCSKTLLIVDERYNKQPLMSWKHHLKHSAMFLDNLFVTNNSELQHYALISDAFSSYAYQFCTKQGMVVSCNFPYKLDAPIDMINELPETFDKRLDNQLKHRLDEHIVGFKPLRYSNSFALFQVRLNVNKVL